MDIPWAIIQVYQCDKVGFKTNTPLHAFAREGDKEIDENSDWKIDRRD